MIRIIFLSVFFIIMGIQTPHGMAADNVDGNGDATSNSSQSEMDEAKNVFQAYRSLAEQKKYQEAVPLAERFLAIVKHLNGTDDMVTTVPLRDLGNYYISMEDYSKSESYYLKALEIEKNILDKHGPDYADVLPEYGNTLTDLAVTYTYMQNAQKLADTLGLMRKVASDPGIKTDETTGRYVKAE